MNVESVPNVAFVFTVFCAFSKSIQVAGGGGGYIGEGGGLGGGGNGGGLRGVGDGGGGGDGITGRFFLSHDQVDAQSPNESKKKKYTKKMMTLSLAI
jgi:hypothetical protein